jgi:hypothetical protein
MVAFVAVVATLAGNTTDALQGIGERSRWVSRSGSAWPRR